MTELGKELSNSQLWLENILRVELDVIHRYYGSSAYSRDAKYSRLREKELNFYKMVILKNEIFHNFFFQPELVTVIMQLLGTKRIAQWASTFLKWQFYFE